MAPLLSISDLHVYFGAHEAVRGLSLAIEPGEALGLVGESGSGKSVTSLAILGLLGKSARATGRIEFDGQNLLQLGPRQLQPMRGRRIAMIFQEPMTALNPVMRIGRQIGEAWQAHHPGASRTEVHTRTLEALESVAIPDAKSRMNDYPHQFSGGQRQRILIAMALVNQPQLLIADEPTTALDVTVQAQIIDLLLELRRQRGLSMLFISHDLAVVGRVADRVAVLKNGVQIEAGPTRQILTNPEADYTKRLLAAVPTLGTDRSKPLAQVGH